MKPTKSLLTTILLTSGLALAPSAHAGSQGSITAPSPAKTAKAQRKTAEAPAKKTKTAKKSKKAKTPVKKAKNFDFTGDTIDTNRIRPDGTAIFGLQGAGHKSLIRLRSEFIGEIVKSAEML